MLFAGPTGVSASGRDRPLDRAAIGLPHGMWQAAAAVGPSGAILLVTAADRTPATAVVGQLVGGWVESRWVVALPASVGPTVLPGCVGGDGRAVVVADGLVYLDSGRMAETRDVPRTVGRCQLLENGTVAYLAEADHAVTVWRPDQDTVVVTGTRCDDFAVGGGEMACLDDAGDVAVGPLVLPIPGGPVLDVIRADHLAGPVRQVLLSPTGAWLAVVARDGPEIKLYDVAGGRVAPAGASSLRSGEVLLGLLDP